MRSSPLAGPSLSQEGVLINTDSPGSKAKPSRISCVEDRSHPEPSPVSPESPIAKRRRPGSSSSDSSKTSVQSSATSNWMTTNPYAETPRFSRLSLSSATVIMPVSAKSRAGKRLSTQSSRNSFSSHKKRSPSLYSAESLTGENGEMGGPPSRHCVSPSPCPSSATTFSSLSLNGQPFSEEDITDTPTESNTGTSSDCSETTSLDHEPLPSLNKRGSLPATAASCSAPDPLKLNGREVKDPAITADLERRLHKTDFSEDQKTNKSKSFLYKIRRLLRSFAVHSRR
jgi:hypothetical protein